MLHRTAVALVFALLLPVVISVPQLRAGGQREFAVFLLAGQSNMAGADSLVTEPPGFQQTDADKATLFTTAPLPEAEQARQYHPWGTIRGHRAAPNGTLSHGPEVGFARELYRAGWRNVAIIKTFANFTRDADRWPWGPDGTLYERWTTFADARLAELRAQGHRYRVCGFVWHQGIDDAIHGRLAGTYQKSLTALVGVLRNRYGDDHTPFVLVRSVSSPVAKAITGSREQDPMAVVRHAQVTLERSIPQVGWIDVDDLPTVNRHHFRLHNS